MIYFARCTCVLICLSIFSIGLSNAQTTVTSSCSAFSAQKSCGECLRSGPDCSWCVDNSTSVGSQQIRCRAVSENTLKCAADTQTIVNPQGSIQKVVDKAFTTTSEATAGADALQLKPQEYALKLRAGIPQKVNITYKKVIDYPLDLYYVMDLSNSMKDDLEKLKVLGSSLVTEINKVTDNFQLGFGSFVDKVMMPFASTVPEQLQDPCSKSENVSCAPVFGFRHQLPITSSGRKFMEAVNSTNISGNIDSPEGGFDALMQIAVCQDFIKWRQKALHVILFTSDASPHIAMDGKLAAILQANDMKCHLGNNSNPYLKDAIVYTKSKFMDYPSIGQLKEVFEKYKIQTIFAVTESVQDLYKDMPKLLDNSFVDILEADSSNIISVIQKSYNALRSKIQLSQPSKPSNVDMSYRVLCPDKTTWQENSLECTNINIGSEVVFQFEFLSTGCPTPLTKNDQVLVTSNSLQDEVKIKIEYVCECDCAFTPERNSSACSNFGDLQCGVCSCHGGRLGQQCQCSPSGSNVPLEANCTKDGIQSASTPLCNGNGYCECGSCQCDDGYFGKFCQCRNTGCRMYNNKLCGGPEKGTCRNCDENQECVCKKQDGYYANSNGVCICNDKECRVSPTAEICSNHGSCDCDHCDCHDKNLYSGVYCERCIHPTCRDIDVTCSGVDVQNCATCVRDAHRQVQSISEICKALCTDKGLRYQTVAKLPECEYGCQTAPCTTCSSLSRNFTRSTVCSVLQGDKCTATYRVEWVESSTDFFIYVKTYNKEEDCPKATDPLLIVLPVVGGIVLIGLIALIVWKMYQTLHDKMEYESFMEESKQKKWTQSDNPIFSKASVRIENPAYIGGKF